VCHRSSSSFFTSVPQQLQRCVGFTIFVSAMLNQDPASSALVLIYSANYHLVLVTKHRRKCISREMLVRLKEISNRIISTWEGELLEFNGESDHVHLLLSIPPKVAPTALVNNLKTVTARLIRKEFAGALAKVYDKPVFWSRSY
jgi:putative transposase